MIIRQKRRLSSAAIHRRQFWKTGLRSVPFQYLLLISLKARFELATRALNKRGVRTISRVGLKHYSSSTISYYREITANTKLWHGSGKLQHKAGQINDVLQSIVNNGSLNPIDDAYAVLVGGQSTQSISTTPLRMIARSYADIHTSPENWTHRYGDPMWWISRYYGRLFAEVFATKSRTIMRNRSSWDQATKDANGDRVWGKKVHRGATYVWDVFGSGSDIPNNYPILFGIANYQRTAHLPRIFAKAEVRLIDPVTFNDLSHLEVPESKISEVKALLHKHKHDIPVVAIELGEYVASQQSLDRLLGLK